ncbi:hypothetical protein AAHD90_15575 [Citrobacter portucalensis]|uniref:Uncharacterized protein n=2 Tax=Enterobacteriaceae TaxID=543 RepID=A0A2H4ZHN2_RAOOR|nr:MULTISPECIES: hypothetical protein [Enterobacteriaceae]AUF80718.1 Hypothetical protein [Raoultella ornithinolytica]WOH44195.1 hypothetical protein RY846_03100 [Citrobacter portucalensis]WOH46199.1 hypothetical protein RY846_25830 [Citrobacter portucalensis]
MKHLKYSIALFLLFTGYSVVSAAAFSGEENSQLASINQKSAAEVKAALESLNKSVDAQIGNNPEYKPLILGLKKSWGEMIEKKCQLETIDSKGTDAERPKSATVL